MFILCVWFFKDGLVDDSTIQMILAFYIGNNTGAISSVLKNMRRSVNANSDDHSIFNG